MRVKLMPEYRFCSLCYGAQGLALLLEKLKFFLVLHLNKMINCK